jgi:hypothetical protein
MLWADVALKCNLNDEHGFAREIVNDRLLPALALLPLGDVTHSCSIKAHIIPALHIADPSEAWRILRELDSFFQEKACHNAISFLFRNELPSDPEDYTAGAGYDIDYGRLAKICDFLEKTPTDWLIYAAIQKIIDCLMARRNDNTIKVGQKEEVFRRLSEIVDDHLPSKRGISHEGFKIICKIELSRYRSVPNADVLIEAARGIPNMADRSLVLFEAALSLSKSEKVRQEQLIREAAQMARIIPMAVDRVERFIGFAQSAKKLNQKLTREMLQEAVTLMPIGPTDGEQRVRRIIDMAYKIDKDFAYELADKLDGDTAKERARREIRILDLRQNVVDEHAALDRLKQTSEDEYAELGPRLLGSLHSGRMDSLRISSTRACMETAGRHPLSESYFVLAWIVENAVDKHSNTDRAGYYLRPIYEACLAAAALSLKLADEISIYNRWCGASQSGTTLQCPSHLAGGKTGAMIYSSVMLRSDARIWHLFDFFVPPRTYGGLR